MLSMNEENDIYTRSNRYFLVKFKLFGGFKVFIMNRVLFVAINDFIKQAVMPLIADER